MDILRDLGEHVAQMTLLKSRRLHCATAWKMPKF